MNHNKEWGASRRVTQGGHRATSHYRAASNALFRGARCAILTRSSNTQRKCHIKVPVRLLVIVSLYSMVTLDLSLSSPSSLSSLSSLFSFFSLPQVDLHTLILISALEGSSVVRESPVLARDCGRISLIFNSAKPLYL